MTITRPTPADELRELARSASRGERFMEYEALVLRNVANRYEALKADRDRLAAEVAELEARPFSPIAADGGKGAAR